jgi:hypothetical protein
MRAGRAAALTLALLAVALGTTACGESTKQKQAAAAQARADAAWRAGIGRWNREMRAALNGMSLLFSRPGPVQLLQAADRKTGAQLARFDETLAHCSATVEALGQVPDGLTQAHELALRACANLEDGIRLVESGVSALQQGLGSELIDRASAPLGAGQDELSAVAAALRKPSP